MFFSFPNPHHLKVGSAIEYSEQSGEVKWIGVLPEIKDKNLMAGVEMVNTCIQDQIFPCTSWVLRMYVGAHSYVCV